MVKSWCTPRPALSLEPRDAIDAGGRGWAGSGQMLTDVPILLQEASRMVTHSNITPLSFMPPQTSRFEGNTSLFHGNLILSWAISAASPGASKSEDFVLFVSALLVPGTVNIYIS